MITIEPLDGEWAVFNRDSQRQFLDIYATESEARAAYPQAVVPGRQELPADMLDLPPCTNYIDMGEL